MQDTTTVQLSAEQAVKGFEALAASIKEMQTREDRIAALQAVVRKISAPFYKQARLLTTDLRVERAVLDEKIAEKEKPLRDEAAEKTEDLRTQVTNERATLKGVKGAIYHAVNPSSSQPSQA